MLISSEDVHRVLVDNSIHITGAFHLGAHECEEMAFYRLVGLQASDIIWIDAIEQKVLDARHRGIPNVYNEVITDEDDKEVTFNIANNVQSSSVLELCTHAVQHPDVVYVDNFTTKSITVDTFFAKHNIDGTKYNFWNFDIQGAELMALKGAIANLKYVRALYLEVNVEELYKECGLLNDIDVFLSEFGFQRVLTHMTRHGWGDALYIQKAKLYVS